MADPPPLPPPPPPYEWTPPAPVALPVSTSATHGWRTARAGWILLHVVIGWALAFVLFTIVGGFLSSSHDLSVINTIDPRDPSDQDLVLAFGGAFWICVLGSVAAWLVFVYLRASTLIRATVLGIGIVLTATIAFSVMASALDRA